jgi:release factor glutamine methyltransferase
VSKVEKEIQYLKKYLPNDLLEKGIERLQSGEPVQYIIGNVNFYGYIFKVNHNVLIPRFETEELVSKTIDYLQQYFSDNIDIVDLGTGSGCIAITLKRKLSNSKVTAVDISKEALEVALENAKINNVDIEFKQGDMLKPLNKKYDLIISNPPYIAYDEPVMDIVKNNEPHVALYADNDGLKYYEEILSDANKYLKEKSLIAFEIGANQGEKIKDIAKKYFPNATIKIEKDMQERNRFIFIFNNIKLES